MTNTVGLHKCLLAAVLVLVKHRGQSVGGHACGLSSGGGQMRFTLEMEMWDHWQEIKCKAR